MEIKIHFILSKYNTVITKTQIIDTLNTLPEDLTVDQVIEHLIFLEKVQKGLIDSKELRVNNKEEAKAKLGKWIK